MKNIVMNIGIIVWNIIKMGTFWWAVVEKVSDYLMYDLDLSETLVAGILIVMVSLYGYVRIDIMRKSVKNIYAEVKQIG